MVMHLLYNLCLGTCGILFYLMSKLEMGTRMGSIQADAESQLRTDVASCTAASILWLLMHKLLSSRLIEPVRLKK